MRSDGVIERFKYDFTQSRRGFSVAGKLGLALGLELERVTAERRLVGAVAWVEGRPSAETRWDCVAM